MSGDDDFTIETFTFGNSRTHKLVAWAMYSTCKLITLAPAAVVAWPLIALVIGLPCHLFGLILRLKADAGIVLLVEWLKMSVNDYWVPYVWWWFLAPLSALSVVVVTVVLIKEHGEMALFAILAFVLGIALLVGLKLGLQAAF